MNSYGVSEVPADAVYGEYDSENGEWTGKWFYDEQTAIKWSEEPDDERLGVVSTTDETDWL